MASQAVAIHFNQPHSPIIARSEALNQSILTDLASASSWQAVSVAIHFPPYIQSLIIATHHTLPLISSHTLLFAFPQNFIFFF